ncbi:MAG: hypothetical protein AAF317_08820 [Pseudomonadota bacterium]
MSAIWTVQEIEKKGFQAKLWNKDFSKYSDCKLVGQKLEKVRDLSNMTGLPAEGAVNAKMLPVYVSVYTELQTALGKIDTAAKKKKDKEMQMTVANFQKVVSGYLKQVRTWANGAGDAQNAKAQKSQPAEKQAAKQKSDPKDDLSSQDKMAFLNKVEKSEIAKIKLIANELKASRDIVVPVANSLKKAQGELDQAYRFWDGSDDDRRHAAFRTSIKKIVTTYRIQDMSGVMKPHRKKVVSHLDALESLTSEGAIKSRAKTLQFAKAIKDSLDQSANAYTSVTSTVTQSMGMIAQEEQKLQAGSD